MVSPAVAAVPANGVDIVENDFCVYELRQGDKTLFSSTHPDALLLKALSLKLVTMREAMEIASKFGLKPEFDVRFVYRGSNGHA